MGAWLTDRGLGLLGQIFTLVENQDISMNSRAIIALAKTFGLKITAEGVETLGQMTLLKEEGCDEMQGYYYSKPLTPGDLRTFNDAQKG